MPSLGAPELIVVLVIVLVVFGPGKLPDLGRTLGKSIREFRKATDDVRTEMTDTVNEVKKPLEDLRRPIDEIRKMPSEVIHGSTGEKAGGTAPSPEVAPKICPQCSAPNPASQPFCGKCGARLG